MDPIHFLEIDGIDALKLDGGALASITLELARTQYSEICRASAMLYPQSHDVFHDWHNSPICL